MKEGDIAAYRDKGYADQLRWWHVKMEHFHGAHDFRRGSHPSRVGSQESLILVDIRKSPICDYTKSKISSHAKIEDFEHFGTSIPKDVTNFTMDRAVRGRPLTKDQKERNRKISSVRAPG
jgi:hypothetical protein